MGPGNGDEVLIRINGDNRGAVNAIRGASDEINRFGSSSQGAQFNLSSLGQEIFKSMGSFGAFAITANSVLGVIGEIGGAVSSVISTFVSFGETIATVVVGALQQAGQEVYNLTQQVLDLNSETQKNLYTWSYLQGGMRQAQALASWSYNESFNIPYTRQDLMQGITTMGSLQMSNSDIEQYLPMLADIGATRAPGESLAQIARAVSGAEYGRTMMLRYQLHINPKDLEQYGYIEGQSPSSDFLPALYKWSVAQGYTKPTASGKDMGAAYDISHQTWWGEMSSAVDRLQNFGLEAGGTNENGTVRKGSFFAEMQQDLNGLSAWWDKHKSDMDKLADLFGSVLGGAVKDATAAFQGFAEGLHKSRLDTLLEQILGGFGRWLNDPGTQAGLKRFGDAFGNLAGTAISTTLEAAGQFFTALNKTGIPQAAFNTVINLFNTMSDFFKNHKQEINDFFKNMGSLSGATFAQIGTSFKEMGDSFKEFKNSMTPEEWSMLKWFISEQTVGTLIGIGAAFKAMADAVKTLVGWLQLAVDLYYLLNPTQNPANFGNPNGNPYGGGGGGGRPPKMASGLGGGGGSYTNTSNTSLHFYGASSAQVAYQTNRLLDERDRGSYLAKRTPGGFSSLGILG